MAHSQPTTSSSAPDIAFSTTISIDHKPIRQSRIMSLINKMSIAAKSECFLFFSITFPFQSWLMTYLTPVGTNQPAQPAISSKWDASFTTIIHMGKSQSLKMKNPNPELASSFMKHTEEMLVVAQKHKTLRIAIMGTAVVFGAIIGTAIVFGAPKATTVGFDTPKATTIGFDTPKIHKVEEV